MSALEVRRLRAALQAAERTIDELEAKLRARRLADEAEMTDLVTARLLTEHAIVDMDEDDIVLIVMELRQVHPELFRDPRTRRADLVRFVRDQKFKLGGDVPF